MRSIITMILSFLALTAEAKPSRLFQTYEDAEDVVAALKSCAEDVGEAGIDSEFGLGIINPPLRGSHAAGD